MDALTLADEVVVLMLDDVDGDLDPGRIRVASVAIAGGVVMELALRGHIDTDLTSLFVVDPQPTGDQLLDEFLQEISSEPEQHSSAWWIDRLSARHGELVEQIRARLVAAGILREEERRFLWMFSSRAYPEVSDREEREAKARLLSILFTDAVPASRDALLLSLANLPASWPTCCRLKNWRRSPLVSMPSWPWKRSAVRSVSSPPGQRCHDHDGGVVNS